MNRRLSWGCGPKIPDGWVGSDRDDFGQEHVGDIGEGLPWPDDSFDVVVANHSLQTLPYSELAPALVELRRVIVRGGVLRVSVPDVVAAFRAWEHRDRAWFPVGDEEPSVDGALSAYLTWYGTNLTAFTPGFLRCRLIAAGFSAVDHVEPHITTLWGEQSICALDDREGESMVFEALV